ncbi:hypothetical protein EW145_g7703 [Phellinidium pouzarii]|uniref:Uncharacterized protein n=1 Tax=Phellinidium pouzarii TaxID=167371 RepID=A0A4S4KFB6_9AGAM|nr:hypothetical protein EW145_g7703 [Phellinidium pouzarii]
MADRNSRSSQQRSQGSRARSALSPHSSAHASSASSGRALRLHNVPNPPPPQPIAYPTPVQVLKGPHDLAEAEPYGDQPYNPYEVSDGVQELGQDHDYDYIDVEEIVEMDQYPERPRQVRRESQDVEFGNRVPRAGGRRHGWEVNVRMPRIREISKGLSKEKAKTLLHSLKVPQNISNLKSFRSLRRAHTVSHPSAPPFEFRDSQPVPQSIRQQYAELAPSDGVVHKSEDGFLAPPPYGPAPVSMLDVELRRSRSQSESHHSQNSSRTTGHRPRSQSHTDSRRDHRREPQLRPNLPIHPSTIASIPPNIHSYESRTQDRFRQSFYHALLFGFF